jgi:adenosylhomocysteine nucleosidase
VAVEFEARRLARGLALPAAGPSPDGGDLSLRRIGLAATDLPRLGPDVLARRPAAVLVTGLAGGCAPDLTPGEIVVATSVGPTPGGGWLEPAAILVERALGVLRMAGLPHRQGRLLTVPAVVATAADKAECWRGQGAVAVDMESAHVLAWAARVGLPALAVRAVADGPGEGLPPALLRMIGPGGALRGRGILACAARPALAGAAWRLWRRSRTALDRLARFLTAFTDIRP